MAEIAFTIPTNRLELLSEVHSNYTVKNIVIPGSIVQKLEEAQEALREEGPNFILDNFDTYYSVLHHADNLRPDVVQKAYHHLSKAVKELDNTILFLLDDQESLNEEIKTKMVSILKMLVYIYIQFVIYSEEKKKNNQDDLVSGRGKSKEKKDKNFSADKSRVLNALNSIIQREINLFWEPPIVEHDFVDLLAELCFVLLQNPSVKSEKEVILEIFGVLGNLIKSYDYKTFVTRLIQTIRMYEHVVHCVIEGIKMVVQQFNCQSLVHCFVKEATEWQVDETFQDAQGTKFCSIFLSELAMAIPDLMLPEVMYLNKYLTHESVPLRIAVLNVLNEIVLKVLTKHDLIDEERELRDELLDVIIEHTRDFSAIVRSKVFKNLSKLQKENAIPLSFQCEVLSEIIKHLSDKAAATRKSAINCLTTFLEHNPFGANLQLKKAEAQLTEKKKMLDEMELTYKEAQLAKLQQLEEEWSQIQNELEEVVKQQLETDDEEEQPEDLENPTQIDSDRAVEEVRRLLREKKYLEAFNICRQLKDSTEEFKNIKKVSEEYEVTVYVTILHSIFVDPVKIAQEFRTGAGMTEEDIKKIETLEAAIKYFENTTEFLRILDSAIKPMKSLLTSQTMSDTHEAIDFFITAYQFQIDRASEGILEMLTLMRCGEQERITAVVEAFKTIYLTTDTRSMLEHTTTIVHRLFALLRDLKYDNLDDFQSIVTEWTSKGILDNSVVDRCWQYYTQRESVSNDDARSAAELLRMGAMGRSTIISKNINVVSKIAFSDQHKEDMAFLASSLRLLAVAGLEKIDVQSENPPFRIKSTDQIFQDLSDALIGSFFLKYEYYSEAMQAGLDFVCRMCSNPLEIIEKMVNKIYQRLRDSPRSTYLAVRFCEFLGCLAVKFLGYLDNNVYRELKRRYYLREERKKENKNKKNEKIKNKRKTQNAHDTSTVSEASTNESILMGAEAEDADAEFILATLENDIVSSKGVLGQLSGFILDICRRPDIYNDRSLQYAAVTALARCMLVSSIFCRDNTQLLFTILERTSYPEIKRAILIHCSDLLTRFPNSVEPWSPRIYLMLKDSAMDVREAAFFSLANLILRAMIRAHSHISEMAACLIDSDPKIVKMCKTFFERLAQKENSFVNFIPDIFSHLVRIIEIDQESLRFILKFLFDLVDSTKRIENLVDRFCCKYTPDDNTRLNRNITYCLSLINYNDKALRKLREKFPTYQHHMHDAEIYSIFKQILNECNKTKPGKTDLRPIVNEIETCIASIFEIGEDGQPAKPPPLQKPIRKQKNKSRKKSARRQASDSEDDSDDNQSSKSKKPSRSRTRRSEDDDSDKEPVSKTKKSGRVRSTKRKSSDSS